MSVKFRFTKVLYYSANTFSCEPAMATREHSGNEGVIKSSTKDIVRFLSEMLDVLPFILFAVLAAAFAIDSLRDSVGFIVLLPFVIAAVYTAFKLAFKHFG
jgi:flagellar biogenesis protein FliO